MIYTLHTDSGFADNRSNMELNQYQSTATTIINRVINDDGLVTLNVVNNSESVVIGDVSTATIDVGDMLALGDDCHVNAGTTLMHETYEQYEIQTKSIAIALAHCHAIGIEKVMMNSNFNDNKLYDDNLLFGNRHQFNIGFGISLMNINNIESISDNSCVSTTVIFKRNNVYKVIDIKH